MEQTKEIVLCPRCNGAGKEVKCNKDGTPYITRGQRTYELCSCCDGERVVVKQVTIEYFKVATNVVEESKKKGIFEKWLR